MDKQNTTSESNETNYGMVTFYAIMIVTIVIVILFMGNNTESFLQPQVRSDVQGDWDIKSELAKLSMMQEAILRRVMSHNQH